MLAGPLWAADTAGGPATAAALAYTAPQALVLVRLADGRVWRFPEDDWPVAVGPRPGGARVNASIEPDCWTPDSDGCTVRVLEQGRWQAFAVELAGGPEPRLVPRPDGAAPTAGSCADCPGNRRGPGRTEVGNDSVIYRGAADGGTVRILARTAAGEREVWRVRRPLARCSAPDGLRISPDGGWLAFQVICAYIGDWVGDDHPLYVVDLARGTGRRVASGPASALRWSRDPAVLFFQGREEGTRFRFLRSARVD